MQDPIHQGLNNLVRLVLRWRQTSPHKKTNQKKPIWWKHRACPPSSPTKTPQPLPLPLPHPHPIHFWPPAEKNHPAAGLAAPGARGRPPGCWRCRARSAPRRLGRANERAAPRPKRLVREEKSAGGRRAPVFLFVCLFVFVAFLLFVLFSFFWGGGWGGGLGVEDVLISLPSLFFWGGVCAC